MNRAVGMIVLLLLVAVMAMAADVSVQVGTEPFDAGNNKPPLLVSAAYDAGYLGMSIWRTEFAISGWRIWDTKKYYSCCTRSSIRDQYGFGFSPRLILDLPVHPRDNNCQVWGSFGGGIVLRWSDHIDAKYDSWTDAKLTMLGRINFRTGQKESFFIEGEHQSPLGDDAPSFDLLIYVGYRFRAF